MFLATDPAADSTEDLSNPQLAAFNTLIASLYSCLHSNRGFEPFFEAFQQRYNNATTAILGLTRRPIRMVYGWTQGYPEGFEQLFINSDLPEQDTALLKFSALPPRHFDSLLECNPDIKLVDLLPPATRAWVEEAGLVDSAGMLVMEDAEHRVVFLANRQTDAGPYTREELQELNLLAPHIENAVRLYHKLYHARSDNESLVAALDHVSKPMIVFNELAQVVKCNHSAEAILEGHPELFVTDAQEPRLRSRQRRFNQELSDAIVTSIINARRGIQDSIILLSGHHDDRIALCITPLGDEQKRSFGALAELYTYQPPENIDRIKLRALFSCTETESRVAAHLMQGLDPAGIADTEKLSIHTVRQHIKNLLAKNGFNRQVELVAALIRVLG